VYAQTLEGTCPAECLSAAFRDELLPALRTQPGFSGALSLLDRGTGRAVVLVFWETEEEARRVLSPFFAGLLARLGVSDAATYAPEVWEVGARA
jgi:hypothetical protein